MTYEEFDKRCDELENAPLLERKTFFADARYPAATWVQVARLYGPKHLLEVEWTVRLK